MNCKFCGKPISEHGVGRETDACVCETVEPKPPVPTFPSCGMWVMPQGACYSSGGWWKLAIAYKTEEILAWWIPGKHPTTSRDAAMRVWEGLPFPRDMWQFGKEEADVAAGGEWPPAWALGIRHPEHAWKLAICHAALMLAVKEE